MPYYSDHKFFTRYPGFDVYPPATAALISRHWQQMIRLYHRCLEPRSLGVTDATLNNKIIGAHRAASNRLASNMAMRSHLGSHLLLGLCEMEWEYSDRSFYPLHLLSEHWLTYDRRTEVRIADIRAAIRRVMQCSGLTGWIGVIRFELLAETPHPRGRRIMPMFAGIGWSDALSLHPLDVRDDMMRARRLSGRPHWRTIAVGEPRRPIVSKLVQNMFEPPLDDRTWRVDADPWTAASIQNGELTRHDVVRQIELLSSVTLSEVLLGGGVEGVGLRASADRHMKAVARASSQCELNVEDARLFWRRVKGRSDSAYSYTPVEILR